MNHLAWLPRCKILPVLTLEQTLHVQQLALSTGRLRPSLTVEENGTIGPNRDHCRASIASFLPETELYQIVANAVDAQLETFNAVYDFDLHQDRTQRLPRIHVAAYNASERGEYKLHTDLGSYPELEERKLTLVILLNDPASYKGGELSIHTGQQVNVQRNCAVGDGIAFPSFSMHAVSPVTQGQRLAVVCWLKGPRFR